MKGVGFQDNLAEFKKLQLMRRLLDKNYD